MHYHLIRPLAWIFPSPQKSPETFIIHTLTDSSSVFPHLLIIPKEHLNRQPTILAHFEAISQFVKLFHLYA